MGSTGTACARGEREPEGAAGAAQKPQRLQEANQKTIKRALQINMLIPVSTGQTAARRRQAYTDRRSKARRRKGDGQRARTRPYRRQPLAFCFLLFFFDYPLMDSHPHPHPHPPVYRPLNGWENDLVNGRLKCLRSGSRRSRSSRLGSARRSPLGKPGSNGYSRTAPRRWRPCFKKRQGFRN